MGALLRGVKGMFSGKLFLNCSKWRSDTQKEAGGKIYPHNPGSVHGERAVGAPRDSETAVCRAYSKEFFGVHNFKSSCMM